MQQAAKRISEVDEALKLFYRERPWDLLRAVCWHQVGYCVGIFQTWLFFNLLKHDVSWSFTAGLWFLGMWFDLLTFAVPMNAGTLEGTRIVALRAIGYSSLLGMTYGVALRLAQLFWSICGLVIYGCLTRQAARQPGPQFHPHRDSPSSPFHHNQILKEPPSHQTWAYSRKETIAPLRPSLKN